MELLERVCMAPVTRRTRQPAPRQDEAGLVKRVWLLLYSEGGTWTEKEIRARLHLADRISSTLTQLVFRGYIVRKRIKNIDGEERTKYGVYSSCKFPRGMTLNDVKEMMTSAEEPPVTVVYHKASRHTRGRAKGRRVAVVRSDPEVQFDLWETK